MKIKKKRDATKSDRLCYSCALAVAFVLGLAHKTGWIEISSKKPVAKVVSAAGPAGRSYYRSDVDRKKRAGDSTSRWKMSGCESLCWSVEEWYCWATVAAIAAMVAAASKLEDLFMAGAG